MKRFFFNCVFYPLAILWSLVYGLIMGIIGQTVAAFLEWKRLYWKDYRQWKRYPQRDLKKHIQYLVGLKQSDSWIANEALHNQYSNTVKTKPVFSWIADFVLLTVATIILLPFRWVAGMIEGPQIVFEDCHGYYIKNILKEPYKSKYQRWAEEMNAEGNK